MKYLLLLGFMVHATAFAQLEFSPQDGDKWKKNWEASNCKWSPLTDLKDGGNASMPTARLCFAAARVAYLDLESRDEIPAATKKRYHVTFKVVFDNRNGEQQTCFIAPAKPQYDKIEMGEFVSAVQQGPTEFNDFMKRVDENISLSCDSI